MTGMNQCVVAVFESHEAARSAVKAVISAGVDRGAVSLIGRTLEDENELRDVINQGDKGQKGVATGAGLGGLLGLVAGAALLPLPGLGPFLALGPLAAGATGAVVGGLLGGLSEWGVEPDEVERYEKLLKEGQSLVVVAGPPEGVATGEEVLRTRQPSEIKVHATESDSKVD